MYTNITPYSYDWYAVNFCVGSFYSPYGENKQTKKQTNNKPYLK